MTPPGSQRRNAGFKLLLSMACLIIVIGGLKVATELLIPIMLGLFMAILSLPITRTLEAHRVPTALAVIVAVLVDVLILTGIVFTAATLLPDFQSEVNAYIKRLHQMALANIDALQRWLEEQESLEGFNIELTTGFEQLFNLKTLLSFVDWVNQTDVIQRITSLLTKSFFAFILMIFILAEAHRFTEKVDSMVEAKGPDFQKLRNASRDVQRYLAIKTVVSIATGLLAWLVCLIFGVKFAVLWGLVAFFFNYVPTIGSLVAAIPPLLLGLIEGGFWTGLGVTLCYLAINVAIGNFIEPMLLGKRFGISTVVVILSVLFWGWIWGPVGMFLAVPLTMMIKMMLDNSDDFRWLSIAMGKNRDEEFESLIEEKVQPSEADDTGEPTREVARAPGL